jgi:hypothetical protein
MFIASQLALRTTSCVSSSIPSYSVAIGILLYASIYLYILFYHNEYISVFNKFIIYIVGIDLLLSAFYHMSSNEEPPSNYSSFSQEIPNSETIQITSPSQDDIESDNTDAIGSDTSSENNDISLFDELEGIEELPEELDGIEELEQNVEVPVEIEELTLEEPKKRRGRPPKVSVA